ncbi:MAG: PilZ domain-containing protein [Planctomycetota bacterium]
MSKRDFTRVSIPNQVRVTANGESSLFHAPINLSREGMHLRSPNPPAKGDEVRIEILLGDFYTVRAEARVVWREGDVWGAQFRRIDDLSLELLKDLIRFHAMDSDKVEQEFEDHGGGTAA